MRGVVSHGGQSEGGEFDPLDLLFVCEQGDVGAPVGLVPFE